MIQRAIDSVARRLQLAAARVHPGAAPAFLTQGMDPQLGVVETWVREYLGRPHPELGRKGPVCPFSVPALNSGALWIASDEKVDGTSLWRLRWAVLGAAAAFERRAWQNPTPDLTALVLVFRRLPAERYALLDRAHAQLKTALMARDVMVSSLHPASTAPALGNPAFPALRAPFPAFAFRIMDVRDIVFVGHNELAFARYRSRFGQRFEKGLVTDDFGHLTAWREALKRFP